MEEMSYYKNEEKLYSLSGRLAEALRTLDKAQQILWDLRSNGGVYPASAEDVLDDTRAKLRDLKIDCDFYQKERTLRRSLADATGLIQKEVRHDDKEESSNYW